MDKEKLLIRIMEEEDIEPARLMHNDATTLFQLSDVRHISQPEQQQWFEAISLAPKARRYAVRDKNDNSFIGLFRVDQIDMNNGSATIGLDICKEQRGKGYAKPIYKYFLEYLFLEMRLHRLDLVTLATNNIAISLYQKLGFVQEGRLRQAIWRNGSYTDLLLFSLLKDEYKASLDDN